jgi:hypothetical protein
VTRITQSNVLSFRLRSSFLQSAGEGVGVEELVGITEPAMVVMTAIGAATKTFEESLQQAWSEAELRSLIAPV